MSKNPFYAIALFFSFILVIIGCSKKNDAPATVTATTTNLVGTYKFTAETTKSGTSASVDEFASLDACEKDDLVKINSDASIDFIDAGTVCTPPNNDTTTWSLPNSTTFLIGGDSYTIKSFDGKTLILTYTQTTVTPNVAYTITIVKQ
jgi:hypothetical protein